MLPMMMPHHIYVIDGPGIGIVAGHNGYVSRNNFKEYVRVRFDGITPSGNTVSGSRCSDKVPWHARFDLVKGAGGLWVGNPASPARNNDVDEGHITIGTAP